MSVLIAIGILVLFVALLFGAYTDLERHRQQIEWENELDELWRDEVGTGRASSSDRGRVATTPAGADDLLGGAA